MYKLKQLPDRLALINTANPKIKPISVDFLSDAISYRRKHGGGLKQAIAKAVGIKKLGMNISVIDATAGLGRDAFILAALGCRVRMIERCPQVVALLQDGIRKAKAEPTLDEVIAKLSLTEGDAKSILKTLLPDQHPDVVYLDPMFPLKTKSALVKKEMQALQDVVGIDADVDELLAIALQVAKKRVVIKRPKLAPCVGGTSFDSSIGPNLVLRGKSCRFDVYFINI